MTFKVRNESDNEGRLIRFFWNWTEFAYIVLAVRGLKAEIEFPSDWHERRMGWIRLGFGLFTVAIAFPWPWTVPDHYQCSGPRYGFQFCADLFWIHYGKAKGTRNDPTITIYMPWAWNHRLHEVLGEKQSHHYRYMLRSGEIQERMATINPERRVWTRFWFPWKMERRTIDIDFNDEVGERSGSWKGGVTGCSYEMRAGETPLQTLRRMEMERKFT